MSAGPATGTDPLRLVLARHGQTTANVARVLDTRLPGPGLTDLGREQAGALAGELAGGVEGPVRAVYHSRARRAGETAVAVADALGLGAQEVDGIHEVQVGELEGRNDDDAIARFQGMFAAWQRGELEHRPHGGESGTEILARFRAAVDEIARRHGAGGGTVLLVSHGAAVRLAAADLVAHRGVPAADEDHLGNCARVVLDRAGAGWTLRAWRAAVPGGLPSSRDVTG